MGDGLKRAKKAAAATRRKPKPYRSRRYGIINPFGDLWSPNAFDNVPAALRHIAHFWADQPDHDLSKYSVVAVRVTVSVI